MKISAVIVSRNDGYGGHLNERATYCFNSAIDTYDEVIYVDWNSPEHSLLYDIKDNIQFKGNFKHIIIPPAAAKVLTNYDEHAQVCCEVLGRNIGIKRATGDYILSTNIDIIAPRRDTLEAAINSLEPNSFYVFSRCDVDLPEILDFHGGECKYNDYDALRNHLISLNKIPNAAKKLEEGDDYSLVNCCGDFQIAPRHVWDEIRGFEEELIYPLFADTNVQKKAAMHGFGLHAKFDVPFYHINHGRGGGGLFDGKNRKMNDQYRAIIAQNKTQNSETWGFADTEIEFEVF
jgi:hypothetical protein